VSTSRLMPRSTPTTVMSPRGTGTAGGMVPALAKHAGHHVEMFRLRFWWSLLLTVPVILTSHMLMDWFG